MEELPTKEKPKIEIALARPGDAREIKEILYSTWLATYPNEENGITAEDIEDKHKDRNSEEKITKFKEVIEQASGGEKFLVAKDGDKIVGVCLLGKDEERNHLQAMYILPDHQGKGIGKKFWAEAISFFNSDKDTVLEVAAYNTNAIEFYKKLGFQDTGKRWKDDAHKMKSGAVIPLMEMIIKAKK